MGVKGVFFSIDAILSLGFLLIGIWLLSLLTYSLNMPSTEYNELNILAYDSLAMLEYMHVYEAENLSSIRYYIDEGIITEENLNKTIIDLIGYFYLINETKIAENITKEISNYYLPDSIGYELLIGNKTEQAVLAQNNKTFIRTKVVSKTLISGYALNKSVKGHISRASLSKGWKTDSRYAYFGGYVGEGNITKYLDLPVNLQSVLSANMEAEIGSDFELYVNGNPSGTYQKTKTNMSADTWEIDSTHFQPGLNVIDIKFANQSRSYISGGYLKVNYNLSELLVPGTGETAIETYQFPGIRGVINLYSSLYSPGSVNSMEIYLRYRSNLTVSLVIGNTTLYSQESEEVTSITLNDSDIKGKNLNYDEISDKTVPLRFKSENISLYFIGFGGTADSVLVTDVSGSMGWCDYCRYDCCLDGNCITKRCESSTCEDEECGECETGVGICSYQCKRRYSGWFGSWCASWWSSIDCVSDACVGDECGEDCCETRNHNFVVGDLTPQNHYTYESAPCAVTKLDLAKEADKEFVNIVLNATGNQVGLVSYSSSVRGTHDLSIDSVSLNSMIEGYTAGGGTCICCGIVEATNILATQSNSSRQRSMLVMSDGEAGTGCDSDWRTDPSDEAIQAACDAKDNYNITVYTVAFGSGADVDTMYEIAKCGGGLDYQAENLTELTEIYRIIARNITEMSQQEQSIELWGAAGMDSILYPDSYIKINYTPTAFIPEYGEMPVKLEGPRFGGSVESPKDGYFFIPEGSRPISAKVISYSSNYWTDRVYINESGGLTPVFKLWDYDINYWNLGDPYIIQIPVSLLTSGINNSVRMDTGTNRTETAGGSPDNKVIFEISLNVFVPYGDVFEKSLGSKKTVWYDSNQDGTADGSVQILVGNNTDDEFDPDIDAMDDAFLRLLDKLNFINDIGDNDGEQTNPIDVVISEIQIQETSIPEVTWMWGPTDFKMVVWN